jgi:uncharacterized membrane protein
MVSHSGSPGHDAGVLEEDEPEAQQRDVDRLTAFSDGVFAIAITLLVLSIEVPNVSDDHLGEALRDLTPQLLTYALSFVVIGRYWIAHHKTFRSLRRADGTLLWINLALLGFIALLPFPTEILSQYGDTALGTIVYAATLVAVGLLASLLQWYVDHAGLATPLGAQQLRDRLFGGLVVAGVFAVSIPIALVSPEWAKLSWLLMVPLGMLRRRLLPGDPDD